MQKKIHIRFITFSLFLCITISSIFSSYTSTYCVNAETDTVQDIICDIVLLACSVGGCVVSGGTMSPLLFASSVASIAKLEGDIFDYCSDNGDGTATISSDTIQMILDSSAYHIAEDGFSFEDIENYNSSVSRQYYAYIKGTDGNGNSALMSAQGLSDSFIAGSFNGVNKSMFYIKGTFDFISEINVSLPAVLYRDGKIYKSFALGSNQLYGVANPTIHNANFPIFESSEDRDNFLTTGLGYDKAINYNPSKVNKLKYGTNYNPIYNGGSKTFNINRLKNFSNYYTKVINNNVNTDTDAILNILLEYILDTSEPETETETESETDTTPVGTDLNDTNNWLKKIYNRIGDFMTQAKQIGDDIIKQLKAIKRWSAVDAVFDGVDAIADWLQFLKSLFDDVGAGVATLAGGFADTATLITQKFPFSIPWDIAFLIAFLADTPATPVFDIPIKLDSYGINQTLTIDFSQFSAVSKISRMLLTMIYVVGLLKLTSKIISNKKGG